jgi:hypothetical protein
LANADRDVPEANGIEDEIVRALQSEEEDPALPPQEQPRLEQPRVEQPRQEQRPQEQHPGARASEVKPAEAVTAGAKTGASPATTLGDLAERLEEALAREVNAANQTRSRVDDDLDVFDFELDRPSRGGATEPQHDAVAERPQPEPQRATQSPPQSAPPAAAPAAARVIAPSPEPEWQEPQAPAERQQEEAPVINLHERRREAADPLEDEMARLLGELTGDSNRR